MTTKALRELLKTQKLTFVFPGEDLNNYYIPRYSTKKRPFDLTVTVYPKKIKDKDESHKVFINGTNQHFLKEPLFSYWFKYYKDCSREMEEIKQDWRALLELNDPPIPDRDVLFKYLKDMPIQTRKWHHCKGRWYYDKADDVEVWAQVNKKGRKKLIKVIHKWKWDPDFRWPKKKNPKLYRLTKRQLLKESEKLVCVKDVVTNAIGRRPVSIAKRLVDTKEHIVYATKEEWRHYKVSQKPRIIHEYKEKWVKIIQRDEDGNPINDPSLRGTYQLIDKPKPRMVLKYLVRNRKIVGEEKTSDFKHKSHATYDRHAKRQLIPIKPETNKEGIIVKEKFVVPVYEPEYEYVPVIFSSREHPEPVEVINPDGEVAMRKVFKKLNKISATIELTPRIIYKTIITKQYPSKMGLKRSIIKKNMKLLQEMEEKRKKEELEKKPE